MELSIKGQKTSDWVFETNTNRMHRVFTACIPFFFGGEGKNTVGELKDLLKELPEDAEFWVEENDISGRDTLYVQGIEYRIPTEQELQAEQARHALVLQERRRAEAARLAGQQALKRGQARRNILKDLKIVDGAIHMVQNEALSCGDPESRATYQEELDLLLIEKSRLEAELLKL